MGAAIMTRRRSRRQLKCCGGRLSTAWSIICLWLALVRVQLLQYASRTSPSGGSNDQACSADQPYCQGRISAAVRGARAVAVRRRLALRRCRFDYAAGVCRCRRTDENVEPVMIAYDGTERHKPGGPADPRHPN